MKAKHGLTLKIWCQIWSYQFCSLLFEKNKKGPSRLYLWAVGTRADTGVSQCSRPVAWPAFILSVLLTWMNEQMSLYFGQLFKRRQSMGPWGVGVMKQRWLHPFRWRKRNLDLSNFKVHITVIWNDILVLDYWWILLFFLKKWINDQISF